LRREDFWFIVAQSKEAKMRQKTGPQTSLPIEDDQGHPPRHAQASFGRGQNPHRAGRPAWRGQYCRDLCRREGIAESLYYSWSKEFLEAGKKRLLATPPVRRHSDEVKVLRREDAAT
jgi:transposase